MCRVDLLAQAAVLRVRAANAVKQPSSFGSVLDALSSPVFAVCRRGVNTPRRIFMIQKSCTVVRVVEKKTRLSIFGALIRWKSETPKISHCMPWSSTSGCHASSMAGCNDGCGSGCGGRGDASGIDRSGSCRLFKSGSMSIRCAASK